MTKEHFARPQTAPVPAPKPQPQPAPIPKVVAPKPPQASPAPAVREVIPSTPAQADALPDVDALRLSQDYAALVETEEALAEIRVTRPNDQIFIRVHPDEAWRVNTMVIEDKADRSLYLVAQNLWQELDDEVKAMTLYVCVTALGSIFIWPVKLPGTDGDLDSWNRSAHEAALLAMKNWLKLLRDNRNGCYKPKTAKGDLGDPQWPEGSFQDLLRRAFAERYIASLDHPVVRRLWGMAS